MSLFKDSDDEKRELGIDSEEHKFKYRGSKKYLYGKDLKPEDRKHLKKPKKPWSRKERLLVLLTLIITSGTSGFLALSARSWKLPGLPRLAISRFSIPFFSEETIVLEGNRVDQEKGRKIISEFKEKTKSLSGVYGLYIVHLDSGYSFGVNENEIFQAASLIKLPVMSTMYKRYDTKNLDLDERYVLKDSDKVAGSGSFFNKPGGYQITYRNLLLLMGKQSDNTAFKIARTLLGDDFIQREIDTIGMVSTDLKKNETTPKDIGIFFEELWKGNIVSPRARDDILDSLTDTIYEDWLAAGIPKEVRVAHKFGREVHVINDAGIVFSKNPYVVVIMSKGILEKEADEIIPKIARIIYEIENKD
mgnify:FL=1